MKDLIAVVLSLALVAVAVGPLLLARHIAVRNHLEQFKATGAPAFPLPTSRELEDGELKPSVPAVEETQETPVVVLDPVTHEMVRLDADGVPMTEADIAARTAPTTMTVDPERLAEILQLEKTAEYVINPATWAEIGAAEVFMRDPLTAAVLPPEHLMEDAGAPAMAATFWALVDAEVINESGWKDGDSDFRFWTLELEDSLVS